MLLESSNDPLLIFKSQRSTHTLHQLRRLPNLRQQPIPSASMNAQSIPVNVDQPRRSPAVFHHSSVQLFNLPPVAGSSFLARLQVPHSPHHGSILLQSTGPTHCAPTSSSRAAASDPSFAFRFLFRLQIPPMILSWSSSSHHHHHHHLTFRESPS